MVIENLEICNTENRKIFPPGGDLLQPPREALHGRGKFSSAQITAIIVAISTAVTAVAGVVAPHAATVCRLVN